MTTTRPCFVFIINTENVAHFRGMRFINDYPLSKYIMHIAHMSRLPGLSLHKTVFHDNKIP